MRELSNKVNMSNEDEVDDRTIERPVEEPEELDGKELSQAFSNKNSFISYFEDKNNIPDHTFDNLKHSVEYILNASR